MSIDIRVTSSYGTTNHTITNVTTSFIIGRRSGGGVRVNAQIANKQLVLTFTGVNANVIDELGNFQILQLSTTERSYNEFKFKD